MKQKGIEQTKIQILEEQLQNRSQTNISQAEILNNLGLEYYKNSQYKKAIDKHIQVLKILPRQEQQLRLIAFRLIGENYRKLGKFKKGLQYCHQHLEISEQSKNELEIQRAYTNLGLLYMDQAESYLEKYKSSSEEFQMAIQLSIHNLIESSEQIKRIIESRKSHSGYIDILLKNKFNQKSNLNDTSMLQLQELYADSIYNIANAYVTKGQWDSKYYDLSIEKLKEALKEAQQIQYTILQGKCYNTMGLIYLNQKKYEQSYKQFIKDAQICEVIYLYHKLNYKCGQQKPINFLVNLFYHFYEQKGGDISGLIDSYVNIGISYQGLREYKKAQEYFQKGLSLSKQNKMSDQIEKTVEKLENLKSEIKIREDSQKLDMQIKKLPRFNEELSIKYCTLLFDLEEFQAVIDFTSKILQSNKNNIQILVQKALAEEKSRKYAESKESFEKIIQIQRKSGQKTDDYARNLIDYANVLDELESPIETIEAHYQEAYDIAVQLNDFYTQKVVLENLDIVYEQKKMSKKRRDAKKIYNQLLANHPELKQSSASKKSGSSSSDTDSSMCMDDDEDDNYSDQQSKASYKVSRNRSQEFQNQKHVGKSSKSKERAIQNKHSFLMEEEEDEDLDLTFRTNKKNRLSKMSEEEEESSNGDENQKQQQSNNQKHQKNLLKSNKNFIKQENSPLNNKNERRTEQNQNKGIDLLSVINTTQIIQEQKIELPQRNISEIYKQKCKKYFIPIDQDLLKAVEDQQNINLKKRFYIDMKLVPLLKTIRSHSNLQILNLSYNLLTNKSLNQLNLPKYNKNLQVLNLAYNHFIYDDIFYEILLQCQSLTKLKCLNISALGISENHQDSIWHQILLIPALEQLKFKFSSLNQLPDFLPAKIQQTKLDDIVLKNNPFDKLTQNVLSDLLSFREFKRFSPFKHD